MKNNRLNITTVMKALLLTLFLYGLLGWLYIAAIALVHPYTLHLQLTHLASWPREDTFGIISFAVSSLSFFGYNLIKDRE